MDEMITRRLVATLRERVPTLLAAYLFGSRANGHAGPDSDLDLAILTGAALDPVAVWELAQDLAEQANCDVDLVDLRVASTVMQYQVITTGVRLWQKDGQAALYESFILSDKTELDEARAGVLQDIQRGGQVYGSTNR